MKINNLYSKQNFLFDIFFLHIFGENPNTIFFFCWHFSLAIYVITIIAVKLRKKIQRRKDCALARHALLSRDNRVVSDASKWGTCFYIWNIIDNDDDNVVVESSLSSSSSSSSSVKTLFRLWKQTYRHGGGKRLTKLRHRAKDTQQFSRSPTTTLILAFSYSFLYSFSYIHIYSTPRIFNKYATYARSHVHHICSLFFLFFFSFK